MKKVEQHIAKKQKLLADHAFFAHLSRCQSERELLSCSSLLGFWVLVSQDILRLLVSHTHETHMLSIVRHYQMECQGREEKFLHDMNFLNQAEHSLVTSLFDQQFTAVRDASYQLMVLSQQIEDDRLRVVFVLCLQALDEVLFGTSSELIAALACVDDLRYLLPKQLQADSVDATFEAEMARKFLSFEFCAERRIQAINLIDQVFKAYQQLFAGILVELGVTIDADNSLLNQYAVNQ